MRYLSVCSGIEAATVAWHPLGWEPVGFSEIEPFPSAVLAYHYPDVPNLGDMTRYDEWPESLLAECDLIVGGCPCQAFSVAGLRNSLSDDRGNLTLVFVKLIEHIDNIRKKHGRSPAIIVYENVPGILSTSDNAYGNFLGALAGEDIALEPPGGRWTDAGLVLGPEREVCWRVLDAQYFGVAQRRRRVFVVASSRTGAVRASQVLLVEQGVRRDSPPSREERQGAARTARPGAAPSGGIGGAGGSRGGVVSASHWDGNPVHPTLNQSSFNTGAIGYSNQELFSQRGSGLVPTAVCATDQRMPDKNRMQVVTQPVVPYDLFQITAPINRQNRDTTSPCHTLARDNAAHAAVVASMAVRRLTPRECERLQGFPDDYTRIPWKRKPADECPDGPRYKALGNSMAVPVMRWIGERIAKVEAL